ncbi:Retrovirus-related Pol polyprotein from transposon TNT 1-94 [Eumeta japonica]|uniref:Retrovirus-related Pol polyprotein from transposon TNT 1-94 n=1 Tax=Eumeta variegata TaxID=151549 RepID=A0A4C1WDB1_EUMVA|nr:Retrovirus-related Pol polyprotein from transposon TNT 1-94 [Eumeta japonica]
METQSLGGAKYFLTFLDDYSKKVFVYILNNKTEVLSKFKEFKTEVENQSECKLKCIRTDNGLEYVNKPFSDFLISAGIRHQTTTPYTPEQNGAAERNKNKEQTYLCYDECVVPEQVPDTYKEAISCENAEKWKSLLKRNLKPIEEMSQRSANGSTLQVQTLCKGLCPSKGIDYKETFSPTVSVPVDPHSRLEKSVQLPDKNLPYREAVGSLMHVAIVSRPDVMFAVNLVSRFLNCYDESHWTAVKKILKYLKDTVNYGLCYITSSKSSELIGFSDADYANDVTTRRSTTGYIFIKNGAAVTWSSQRQHTVALSTTEAELQPALPPKKLFGSSNCYVTWVN